MGANLLVWCVTRLNVFPEVGLEFFVVGRAKVRTRVTQDTGIEQVVNAYPVELNFRRPKPELVFELHRFAWPNEVGLGDEKAGGGLLCRLAH